MKKACLVFDVLTHALNVTVFDQDLNVLYHLTSPKNPLIKESGHSAEDLKGIEKWFNETFDRLKKSEEFQIIAVNFTSYVGGLVHLDAKHTPIFPVLDINASFDYKTRKSMTDFFESTDGLRKEVQLAQYSLETAALQLLFIKEKHPSIFKNIAFSISIAQYLQSLYSKQYFHDFSTIGCHSAAWDFSKESHHTWLKKEGINSLNIPIKTSEEYIKDNIIIGPGMYYKVAETIPFLSISDEPFILLSTGAWTIAINPFNQSKSSISDLDNNCFNILNQNGEKIKMARLFSGNEHTRQLAHLAMHYGCDANYCLSINFDRNIVKKLRQTISQVTPKDTALSTLSDSPFMERNLNNFSSVEEAYHQFFMDLVAQQVASIKLTLEHRKINRKIYVEGGLAKNDIFMQLLSEAFHDKAIYKVEFEDTAAMGAAMAIGNAWGANKPTEEQLQIELIH